MAMLLSVFCFVAYAQKTVTGTVVDATGEPMIGVSILVDGTTNGGVTDFDGNFSIKDVPENGVLKISYVGFKDQKISVAGKSSINVTLEEDAMGLDEIVVVGYGTMKKKDLTGAVASVKQGDIAQVAAPNAMQAMQAKVPGVDMTASNSPLIIVDGVEYSGDLDVAASDIESMDILKDAASTAIYGTKGANGVIIITTKRGKSGKTRVDFSAYLAFKSPTNAVKSMYGNTEVQRFVDRENYKADLESGNWGSSAKTYSDVFGETTIAGNDKYKIADLIARGDFVDWYDLFMQNSTSQNYEASVSGGNEKTNFSVSFAGMFDKGLLKNDKMNRYSGRANIDHIINKVVKIGASMAFTYKSHDSRNNSVFDRARKMTSLTTAYLPDGSINETPNVLYPAHVNPLMDEGDNYSRNIETTRYQGSGYLQLTPIKGLTMKSQFAVDRTNQRDGMYNDYHSVNRYQSPTTTYIQNAPSNRTYINWQNTINYSTTFNEKHDLTVLLGHEMTQTVSEGLTLNGTAGQEHYYTQQWYDVSKIQNDIHYESKYVKQRMLSFFGRVNYAYNDRYLLSASIRADGSSVLAEGKKWGYFPSVSAGWRISEENFMEGTKSWLDNLKFRVAWGVSGNAAVDPYQTIATVFKTTPGSATNFIPMSLSNPELTWETTSSLDFGLDFESKGRGIEIALNALAVKTKDFSWDINASYTHSKDELKKLADGMDKNVTGTTALIVGQPLSIYYDYETTGCWGVGEYEQYLAAHPGFTAPIANYGTPGTLKITDSNGDNMIDESDKIVYQRSPKHIIGLTNTFTYKDFSLSIQAMARLGGYFQYAKNNALGLNDGDANWADVDYWTPSNQGAKFPSPGSNGTGYSNIYTTYMTSLLYEKADFLKIKDITLSWNVYKKWLEKAHISNAKIYCSLKNYITFSKVDKFDPEAGGSINFPLAKQVIVGVNVSF